MMSGGKGRRVFSFLWRLLSVNFLYKIFALVLAALSWYLIQGREIIEINRQLNVTIRVPEGYGVKGSAAFSKDATIRGSRAHLARFDRETLEAEVRIVRQSSGSYRVRLSKEHVHNWNERVNLTVHEPYIQVEIDRLLKRKLPVEVLLQGVPADNYIVEKSTVKPAVVSVSGLQSAVAKLQKISTLPVDINGLQKNKSFVVGLAGAESGISHSVREVTVTLQVGEKKVNKTFKGVDLEVVDVDSVFYATKIKPSKVDITVQGVPAVLGFIDSGNFQAFVDVGDLGPGKHERRIKAKIPEETVLIDIKPANAFVEIDDRVNP